MFTLPHWLFPGDDRPTAEIDDEIEEELRLHLDLLAEQQMRSGATPEEAKQHAAERFGDLDSLKRRCRAEKQGDVPMLKRVQAVLIGMLLVAIVVMGWQQWAMSASVATNQRKMRDTLSSLKNDLIAIRSSVVQTPEGGSFGGSGSPRFDKDRLSIRVCDESDAPLPDAELIFTWTNLERDHFATYNERVDADGRHETQLEFRNKQLDEVTVVAPGYAVVSESLNRPFSPNEVLRIALPRAVSPKLRLMLPPDDDHPAPRPLADAEIRLQSRSSKSGASGLGRWLSNRYQTDKDGLVTIDQVAPGDTISLMAYSADGTWTAGTDLGDDISDSPITITLRRQGRIGGGFGGGGGAF